MIDENVLERLKPYLTEVSYPKGYVLFNNEKLERNIYFIKRGMARAFVEVDGREVTIWFGQEGDVIISARGYVYGEKGYETMVLLEDSELYRVSGKDLQDLYCNDIVICNWASIAGKTGDTASGAVAAYRIFLGDFLGTSEPDSGDH